MHNNLATWLGLNFKPRLLLCKVYLAQIKALIATNVSILRL